MSAAGSSAQHDMAASPATRSLAFLLVEDDPLLRMSLADVVMDMGHRVVEAATAAEALDHLAQNSGIEVLLTDVGLPVMDGRELADRARHVRPDLRIIFATGYSAARVPDPAEDSQSRCLRKPFGLKELKAALESLGLPGTHTPSA